jgi:hypothetical protein
LLGLNSFAQEKFATFAMVPGTRTFEVLISGTSENDFKLWIDGYSVDKTYKKDVGFYISDKNYNQFVIQMMEAQIKYEEWKNVAIENNITADFDREMKTKLPRVTCYFRTYSDYHFDYSYYPKSSFRVVDLEGLTEYWLGLYYFGLKSSSNEYIKHDGFTMIFSSKEMIEDFLSAISYEKIVMYFQEKQNKGDLFKD